MKEYHHAFEKIGAISSLFTFMFFAALGTTLFNFIKNNESSGIPDEIIKKIISESGKDFFSNIFWMDCNHH